MSDLEDLTATDLYSADPPSIPDPFAPVVVSTTYASPCPTCGRATPAASLEEALRVADGCCGGSPAPR